MQIGSIMSCKLVATVQAIVLLPQGNVAAAAAPAAIPRSSLVPGAAPTAQGRASCSAAGCRVLFLQLPAAHHAPVGRDGRVCSCKVLHLLQQWRALFLQQPRAAAKARQKKTAAVRRSMCVHQRGPLQTSTTRNMEFRLCQQQELRQPYHCAAGCWLSRCNV